MQKNIYKKSKIEISKLKSIASNLDRPFTNTVFLHFGADNELPTDVSYCKQRKKKYAV